MASILQKSSIPAFPFLTLGSICIAHFLLSPLFQALFQAGFESPSSVFDRFKGEETVSTWSNHGDDANNGSHLLEHVPDDFYSHLYAAAKSYLIQNELPSDGDEKNPDDRPDLGSDLAFHIINKNNNNIIHNGHTNLDPASVEKSLVFLKRQGAQAFAVDDFENYVDFSAISREISVVGDTDFVVAAEPTDGGDGSGGSGK